MGFTNNEKIVHSVALVIGVGAYQEASPLPVAVEEARMIAEALASIDVDVMIVEDGSREQILSAMEAFALKTDNARIALCYYTGHGMTSHGDTYVIPADARIESTADIASNALPLNTVLGSLQSAKTAIMIYDTVQGNPFASSENVFHANADNADVQHGTPSIIAYATRHGGGYHTTDEGHSLYAECLREHLRTPGLTLESLFQKTAGDVVFRSHGAQRPYFCSSLIKPVCLVSEASPILFAESR